MVTDPFCVTSLHQQDVAYCSKFNLSIKHVSVPVLISWSFIGICTVRTTRCRRVIGWPHTKFEGSSSNSAWDTLRHWISAAILDFRKSIGGIQSRTTPLNMCLNFNILASFLRGNLFWPWPLTFDPRWCQRVIGWPHTKFEGSSSNSTWDMLCHWILTF